MPSNPEMDRAEQEFTRWLLREMPQNTIIGDPGWWAARIWTFASTLAVRQARAQREQERGTPLTDAEVGELWDKVREVCRIEGAQAPTDWDGTIFRTFAMRLLNARGQSPAPDVLPSEALFGFMGWLTSRDPVAGPFSAHHNASQAAELVAEFCKSQGWESARDAFPRMLKDYPTSAANASSLNLDAERAESFRKGHEAGVASVAAPDVRALQREAASKALTKLLERMRAGCTDYQFAVPNEGWKWSAVEFFRDRYLKAEYAPDPAPPSVPVVFGPCVLDNGNTIGLGAVTSVLSDDETVAALLDPKDTRADEARLRAWLKQARHFLSSHPAASHGGRDK